MSLSLSFLLTRLFSYQIDLVSRTRVCPLILANLMTRTCVFKVRRVERHEVIVMELPNDILYRAQLDALLAHKFPVVADVGIRVPTERDLRCEVSAVGDDAEVEIASEAIVVPRIDLVDLDDEPRSVVGRHVGDYAEGGGEVF